MATNDQFKALVKSHADRDDSQFYSVAMQVAAKAARSGQDKFAQELRDMVDALRKREPESSRVASVVPVSQPRGELASLLTVSYPTARVADLVLSQDLSGRLRHVLHEQRQRDLLSRHGLTPVRRMLLIGPPGTGKRPRPVSLRTSSDCRCSQFGWTPSSPNSWGRPRPSFVSSLTPWSRHEACISSMK